mmetsp:Transcript_59070/g.120401  ORF Transcript_59070/g.120401 Transcript_59070/m.120401 type:complete len:273 (-) Transcript_59070:312-1130(-)
MIVSWATKPDDGDAPATHSARLVVRDRIDSGVSVRMHNLSFSVVCCLCVFALVAPFVFARHPTRTCLSFRRRHHLRRRRRRFLRLRLLRLRRRSSCFWFAPCSFLFSCRFSVSMILLASALPAWCKKPPEQSPCRPGGHRCRARNRHRWIRSLRRERRGLSGCDPILVLWEWRCRPGCCCCRRRRGCFRRRRSCAATARGGAGWWRCCCCSNPLPTASLERVLRREPAPRWPGRPVPPRGGPRLRGGASACSRRQPSACVPIPGRYRSPRGP